MQVANSDVVVNTTESAASPDLDRPRQERSLHARVYGIVYLISNVGIDRTAFGRGDNVINI